MCKPCRECVRRCVCWCPKQLSNIHTCTCIVLRNTCWNACHTLRKNAHALVYARLCNSAKTSVAWKLLRPVFCLVQHRAGCRLPQACCDTWWIRRSVWFSFSGLRARCVETKMTLLSTDGHMLAVSNLKMLRRATRSVRHWATHLYTQNVSISTDS